jgi:copper chaperone CopZ
MCRSFYASLYNLIHQFKNKKMKLFSIIAAVTILSTTACQAQIKNATTTTVKVYGNCGMCETTIEKAANKSKISKADWNVDTKMATITYDSKKTNVDAVLKSIALAGYDNESFLAPDAAYNKLPGCCKYEREKKTASIVQPASNKMATNKDHNNHQHDSMANATQENKLTPVFNNYFSLKDALVKTDAAIASAKAKDLETAINGVDMEKLPTNVHTVWMKILNNLKDDTEKINNTKDVAQQRDHFMNLSKNIYALIKVAKPTETVYYQFCPMANDGKGANWLSKENAVKNPYYGSQMLTCGKTVETIKQ